MLKLRKNKKGFTLVELIVVIAIMAVLAGTVTGVVVGVLNKSKNDTAQTETQTVATAIVSLFSDSESIDISTLYTAADAKIAWTGASANTLTSLKTELAKKLTNVQFSATYDADANKAGAANYAIQFYNLTAEGGTCLITITYKVVGKNEVAGTTITVTFDGTNVLPSTKSYDAADITDYTKAA